MSAGLRIAVFFNPVGPSETEIFTFIYTQASLWERIGVKRITQIYRGKPAGALPIAPAG